MIAVVALFSACSAGAQVETAATVGTSTRNLLDLQRSGRQAGAELPMLGAASALAYQRYLQANKYPIPEYFSENLNASKTSK
ncbi:MAG: DUF3613 domain-containing protein [Pseudomonadota bacterium]